MKKTMKSDYFVRLTLSSEQTNVLLSALDFFSRVKCGQFDEITRAFSNNIGGNRAEAELLVKQLRRICLHKLDERATGYGIAESPSEAARVAWDILQVVRQVDSYARDPDGPKMLVSYQDPHFVSNSEPRPVAKAINVLDRLAEEQ